MVKNLGRPGGLETRTPLIFLSRFERAHIVSRRRPIGPGGNTTKNAPQPKPRNAWNPSLRGRAALFRFRRKNRQAAVYLTDPLQEASQ